jgi:hypothetical protein
MIIVKINGGMANQLFQYAAGYALASHHKVPLKLDLSYFQEKNNDTKRLPSLDKFPINYQVASKEEISQIFKFRTVDYAWNKLMPIPKKRFYGEKQPGYFESFFDLSNSVYLRGYFQSEKYFINHQQDILSQFTLSPTPFEHLLPIIERLQKEHSVALHIRLGDYLNPTLNNVMAPFNIEYYKQAIAHMQTHLSSPKFYIFSDQIQMAKQLLNVNADIVFVDEQLTKNSDEDFYLMQSCKHQIIANSTFSWWAAYLNKHVHKIVIAPQKWYHADFGDATDLFPPNWVVI